MAERWKRAKEMAARAYEVGFDGYDAACRDLFDALTSAENFTAAAQCFAAESEMDIAEERLMNALDAILGDCTTGGWDDYKFDRSDESLEVYGVRQGMYPVDALVALGFRRVWLHPMRRHGGCGPGVCQCEAFTFPAKEPTR